jgi:hypothetical protein
MHRRAKTPIAGILAAIPLFALSSGAATSQVVSQQIQLGDVFTEQTLDVQDVSDAITVTSAAMGNGFSASNSSGGNLTVRANQGLGGQVTAGAVLNATGIMGTTTTISTSATGNSIDTGMIGGAITANVTQTAGAAGVLARGQIEAEEGAATDINETTQAITNSYGLGLTNAAAGIQLNQYSEGGVLADGGLIVGSLSNQGTLTGQAVANNATLTGVNGSAFRANTTQTSAGDIVQASKFAAYGESYVTLTNATASANNVHATNDGPELTLNNVQTNASYVRAQAEETSATFSSGQATAYGVGNSLLAGSFGADVTISNTQNNTGGGVEVTATLGGGSGYDASSSATAFGNAATGYACSSCTSSLRADNNQTNSSEVGATSHLTTTGPVRSATGSATAVGNNASYYVTAPSQ